MVRRIESPSSINTYKQCPRKYFYSYIKKLPRTQSIYTIRGTVVHSVLEEFYTIGIEGVNADNWYDVLKLRLINSFNKYWTEANSALMELKIEKTEIIYAYNESLDMLTNFFGNFSLKLKNEMMKHSFEDSFFRLKPKVEIEYASEKYYVRGFIDAIHDYDGTVSLWDYKTSRKDDVSKQYRLQMAIYALLYEEVHGKRPDKLGIYFLRHGEREIDVNEELVKWAKLECEMIHLNSESDDIKDYSRNPTPLCKWRTGQCDFYDECYGQKSLKEF